MIAPPAPTAKTKYSSKKMVFPFLFVAIICSYLCAAEERIDTSQDVVRIHRQLIDRHGNFLEQEDEVMKSLPIGRDKMLGRNMPTDVRRYQTTETREEKQGDAFNRVGKQLGNRKAWLDRYKDMLNRWEKNQDEIDSNTKETTIYEENPLTPVLRETIPNADSSSVSFLISGGDQYKHNGRNNGNLEDTLSDHRIIGELQRLMTSTTKSTTRQYYRSTYLSPILNRITTPTYYQTSIQTTTTTTTTTSRQTAESILDIQDIVNKAAVTLPSTNLITPTKPSSGLSSILDSSNVDPAAAAAVLVGGGAAAFLTSLLGSFLPSFDSSKEIDERSDEEDQLIDRITSYTKQKTYPSQHPTSRPRPKRRRKPPKPNRKRQRNPIRRQPALKRAPIPNRGTQTNVKRYQPVKQQESDSFNRNNGRNDAKIKMSDTRIPSLPVRVLPVANVQTGYAQVTKQQQNDNENVDKLSSMLSPIDSMKNNDAANAYKLPPRNHYKTLPGKNQKKEIEEGNNQPKSNLRQPSPEIIDMFCREAVVLAEEKLRNELMTVNAFSYRLTTLIDKYNIPLPEEFMNKISQGHDYVDISEEDAKQEMIVLMLDKTCNKDEEDEGYETTKEESTSPNRIYFLDQNGKEQYVVSSIYSEDIGHVKMHASINGPHKAHSYNQDHSSRVGNVRVSTESNKSSTQYHNSDKAMEMPFLEPKDNQKEFNGYPTSEPELELITAHPNLQHVGRDFNNILSAKPNAPASAVVVTSGFSFDKDGRPRRTELKPVVPKEALRPGSVEDANDYKHLEKLPRRADNKDRQQQHQFESVVQLLTSSLKSRSGNIVNENQNEKDYRDIRSPQPQRATHLKGILDANLKRNLQQGSQYRPAYDKRHLSRHNVGKILGENRPLHRHRISGIPNLGKLNLPQRRQQQLRQQNHSPRDSLNAQRGYYRQQHYHHQQLGLPWPNRTDPVSAFTLHHQTSSTRPIPKQPEDILTQLGVTLSTVYPTTTPSRRYTQFGSLDAVTVAVEEHTEKPPTNSNPASSYDLEYNDDEEARAKHNLNLNHQPISDWNRPKRGNKLVTVSGDNADPSSVEYVYNVTFTAPEEDEENTDAKSFDINSALLELQVNDEFNDSYVDDSISDYYFPIVDLTSMEDEPSVIIKDVNREMASSQGDKATAKQKRLDRIKAANEERTKHSEPEEIQSSNHRINRPISSKSSEDVRFKLPQPGFRYTSRPKNRQRQNIPTNTRITTIVTSKSTTYSAINKSTIGINTVTNRPLIALRQSPISSTTNMRRKNKVNDKDSQKDVNLLLNHRPKFNPTTNNERELQNSRIRQRLTTIAPTTTARTSKIPRLYYPQSSDSPAINHFENQNMQNADPRTNSKTQASSSIHSNMGQFIDHTPKKIIPLIRAETTEPTLEYNILNDYDNDNLGNGNILNHNVMKNHREMLEKSTTTTTSTTITSYFPSKTTTLSFYEDYMNGEDFAEVEDDATEVLNGKFFKDLTINDNLSNIKSETVMNKDGNFMTTEESPNHNGKNKILSGNPPNIKNRNGDKKKDIFNPQTYAYTSPSPPSNSEDEYADVSLFDANSKLNEDYSSVQTKITGKNNRNPAGMTGQKEVSIKRDEIHEQYTAGTRQGTINRNNHDSRHNSGGNAPTRWPTSSNKVNVEGKHDKTPLALDDDYEGVNEEYELYRDAFEDNLIDLDVKKRILGKMKNDRGPISDEEMLVMQAESIANEKISSNAEDLQKDKMQINPEKLAYILIGVCCGLSLLCLIIVAVSIGYKSETHYRLEDDSSALNTSGDNIKAGAKNARRNAKGNISSSNFSSGCDESSTTDSHTTSEADEIDTEGQRSSGDDLSAMKLGPWFNGKNQTIDRSKNIKFPTSVYLDRLEGSDQEIKERRISTNSEEIIKSAAAEIDQNQTKVNANTNTENNSLLSRDTLQSEDPNEVVDLDAITNANTLANEAKLPEKERKALIKNQNQQSLASKSSFHGSKTNQYSTVQDQISKINNGHHPSHNNSSRREETIEKKKKRRKSQRRSSEESAKHNRRPYENSSSDAATIYSHEGSFRFLNADEIESSNRSSANESTTNTAISQALSASSHRHRTSNNNHRRQKERDHQKIQWSDNDDRLI